MVSQQVLKDGSGSAAVTQEIAKDPRKIWRSKSCPRLDEGIFQKNSLSSFLLIGIFPVFAPKVLWRGFTSPTSELAHRELFHRSHKRLTEYPSRRCIVPQ
jgi:hypothetical protein